MFPRDLPLDGDIITRAFYKAFKLEDKPESLRAFADGWMNYMGLLTRVSHDIELAEVKSAPATPSGAGGIPSGPGQAPPP
jgi:hypothetical protein